MPPEASGYDNPFHIACLASRRAMAMTRWAQVAPTLRHRRREPMAEIASDVVGAGNAALAMRARVAHWH